MSAEEIRQQAILILSKTENGNRLTPSELSLLQTAVNYGPDALTPQGLEIWEKLYQSVNDGTYVQPWFHGEEHLTREHTGYVCWKGEQVEHYSFQDYSQEQVAAKELASVCRKVESIGLEVNWSSCSKMYDEAQIGQGMTTPRFHVLWQFDKSNANLQTYSEQNANLQSISRNKEALRIFAMGQWHCHKNGLRQMFVASKEDFKQCINSIHSDASWAMTAYRNNTHVLALADQIASRINVDELASQSELSLFVLALPASTPANETQHTPGESA